MNKIELEKCPFCRSSDVELTGIAFRYAACAGCDAHGPVAMSDGAAARKWNKRVELAASDKVN